MGIIYIYIYNILKNNFIIYRKIGVSDPQHNISFRVIDPQHNIKSEWTIHKQHKIQRELLSNKQKNTRATHSNIHSENRCSVNPDHRNRPGRKNKRTWVWEMPNDILFSLGDPRDNVLQLYRKQKLRNQNNN